MDRINPLSNPVFPASANSWEFMMEMFSLMQGMAKIMEGNYILSGCEVSGGTISAGVVVIDGEILPFLAGVVTEYVVIQEINSSVLDNGVTYSNVYTKRYAKFGTGPEQVAWSSFIRGVKRNYEKLIISTNGTHTLTNKTGYVTINTGGVNLNLPVASEENKGNTIKVYIDILMGNVAIYYDGTSLFSNYASSVYKQVLEFKSDGASWYMFDKIPTASEDFSGIVKFAKTSVIKEGAESSQAVSPVGLKYMTGGLRVTEPIELPDWDMNANEFLNIDLSALGLSRTDIRGAEAWIRCDSDAPAFMQNMTPFPLHQANSSGYVDGGCGNIALSGVADELQLWRRPGGVFDSNYFDMTSFSRGWLILKLV